MKQTSWTLYRVVVVGVESVEERRVQCGRLPEATPPWKLQVAARAGNTASARLGVPMPNIPTDACADYAVTLVHHLNAFIFTAGFFLQHTHLHLASCLHLAALSSLKHTQPLTVSLLLHKISHSRLPLGSAGQGWWVGVMCSIYNSVLYCRRHACLHVRTRSPTISIYLS